MFPFSYCFLSSVILNSDEVDKEARLTSSSKTYGTGIRNPSQDATGFFTFPLPGREAEEVLPAEAPTAKAHGRMQSYRLSRLLDLSLLHYLTGKS